MENNIREYSEGMPVKFDKDKGRMTVVAFNQAGYDATAIDLIDLLEFVKAEMPDIWEKIDIKPVKG